MKRKELCVLSVLVCGLTLSCSSSEDAVLQKPSLANLTNTTCKDVAISAQADSEQDLPSTSLTMVKNGNELKCVLKDLQYPCDFQKVNVKVEVQGHDIVIVEYPTQDMADCLCYVDASFSIKDLEEGTYSLAIYRGEAATGNYDKAYPLFSGTIKVEQGKENSIAL